MFRPKLKSIISIWVIMTGWSCGSADSQHSERTCQRQALVPNERGVRVSCEENEREMPARYCERVCRDYLPQ